MSGPGDKLSAFGQVAEQSGISSAWTGLGPFTTVCSCIATALGNTLVWIAHNDSGNVQGAMNNYYEHH